MTEAVMEPKVKTPKIVEPTIFDLSSPGRTGVTMPASMSETALPPQELLRTDLPLPELAEVDVVRHYMHLGKFNYSVDRFYPLGSCTMIQPEDQREYGSPARVLFAIPCNRSKRSRAISP